MKPQKTKRRNGFDSNIEDVERGAELSFLKQGRPRTYLLRLSVCLSVCLSCLKPKNFGETQNFWWKIWLVENKIWWWCRGGSAKRTPPRKTKFGPTFYVFYCIVSVVEDHGEGRECYPSCFCLLHPSSCQNTEWPIVSTSHLEDLHHRFQTQNH